MTSIQPEPILLTPSFSERPWGGGRLKQELGKAVPETGGPWGEAWELSDHPDGPSRVGSGEHAGRPLGELMRSAPGAMMGVTQAPARYPILIKYIDAAEDLSIQVHPDDATAPEGDRGKTECWYVMDCRPGAQIIYGLAEGVDAEALRAAAARGEMEPCLCRVPVEPGDFIRVPAGTVHAILGGTLICEIQQSSNTTYRLWDWNRKPARELHIEPACAVSRFEPADESNFIRAAAMPRPGTMPLWENPWFAVRWIACGSEAAGQPIEPGAHGSAINVVGGAGELRDGEGRAWPVQCGQTWYLPAVLGPVTAHGAQLRLLASESREWA